MTFMVRAGRIAFLALVVTIGLGSVAGWAQTQPKTLRFIPQAVCAASTRSGPPLM